MTAKAEKQDEENQLRERDAGITRVIGGWGARRQKAASASPQPLPRADHSIPRNSTSKSGVGSRPASNRITAAQEEFLRIADISDGRELSRSWIIDRETGAVELSGVWDATERSKGRADPRRQADDVECPFGTELLALTVGPVHT